MRKKVQIDMAAFRADVEDGLKPADLAEKYGIGKSTAARIKANLSNVADEPEAEEQQAAVDEEVDEYELKITMPTAKLDSLIEQIEDEEIRWAIARLCNQDKANIVQLVLQNRLDDTVKDAANEAAA